MFQWLAVLFQPQDFRLKSLVAILDVARVHSRASQYSPSIPFRSRICQSDCKEILKKSLMWHWAPGEICSAFPLLIHIMVMTGYTTFNQFGQMVARITEHPWKHLVGMGPGAPTQITKHSVKGLARSRAELQLGWHSPFEHQGNQKWLLILYPKYLNSGMSGLAAVVSWPVSRCNTDSYMILSVTKSSHWQGCLLARPL